MKRSYLLILLLLPLIMAPRGGSSSSVKNLMPPCAPASGSCPSNYYFCELSDVVYFCTSPNTWTKITLAEDAVTVTLIDDGTDTPADGECLSYQSSSGSMQWVTCGSGGGSAVVLDLSDNSVNDSTDLAKIITTEATPLIFQELTADELTIDTTQDWPNSATATALAADPTNCTSGEAAGGVNASGTAEACTDFITATELNTKAKIQTLYCVGDGCTGGTGAGLLISDNEIDTFSELDLIVTNKSLFNLEDGGTVANAMMIDGSADEIQLRVQGGTGQSVNVLTVEDVNANVLMSIDQNGALDLIDPGDGSRGWSFLDNTDGSGVGVGGAGETNLYMEETGAAELGGTTGCGSSPCGRAFVATNGGAAQRVITGTDSDDIALLIVGCATGTCAGAWDDGDEICAGLTMTCIDVFLTDGTASTCAATPQSAPFYAFCK